MQVLSIQRILDQQKDRGETDESDKNWEVPDPTTPQMKYELRCEQVDLDALQPQTAALQHTIDTIKLKGPVITPIFVSHIWIPASNFTPAQLQT